MKAEAETLVLLTVWAIAGPLTIGAAMYFTWHSEPDRVVGVVIVPPGVYSLPGSRSDGRPLFADTIKCQGLDAVDEPLCPQGDVDAVFKFAPHYHRQYTDPPNIVWGPAIVTTNGAVSASYLEPQGLWPQGAAMGHHWVVMVAGHTNGFYHAPWPDCIAVAEMLRGVCKSLPERPPEGTPENEAWRRIYCPIDGFTIIKPFSPCGDGKFIPTKLPPGAYVTPA
jgi:hypothetical protein